MASRQHSFNQIVFSGGGIRCFWHGGFLSEVGSFEAIRPDRVTGVSGGALSGASWIAGVEQDLLTLMQDAFALTDKNINRHKSKFTPHQEVYRAVVSTTLDQTAIARVANGPAFQVFLTTPPSAIPPQLAALIGLASYKLDQLKNGSPHLSWTRRIGFGQLCVDAREAARQGKLIDLVVAAATIPPVFKVPLWAERPVLDGGLTEKASMPQPDEGTSLILLTSQYENLPEIPGRTYVQPSRAVAADKIDFTDETKVADTWEQGAQDAREWLAKQ